MPVIFVHGVSNRDTREYRDNQCSRDAFLCEYVFRPLGLPADPDKIPILNPYWGDNGISFRWGNASLPESFDSMETFGSGLEQKDLRIAANIVGPTTPDIVTVARHSLPDAIDLVWGAALPGADTPKDATTLAVTSRKAFDYAAANPKPDWLATASSGNFIDLLFYNMEQYEKGIAPAAGKKEVQWESFGGFPLSDKLKEGVSRFTGLLPSAMSSAITSLKRKEAHLNASMFLGDIFQYLTNRGEVASPGPIVRTVLDAFESAGQKRSHDDPNLIIVGHSLGGVISYDILTYFAPSFEVDAFVTIGSQVALFEEMSLYKHPLLQPKPPSGRLIPPPNIKHWLNVIDPNDIFSFRAGGVFEGVDDFKYETGYGLLHAHSGYFQRPSFYRRLGERLGGLFL